MPDIEKCCGSLMGRMGRCQDCGRESNHVWHGKPICHQHQQARLNLIALKRAGKL